MTIVCQKLEVRQAAARREPGIGRAWESGGGVLDGLATTLSTLLARESVYHIKCRGTGRTTGGGM